MQYIYRPPRRDTNEYLDTFIQEISPVLDNLSKSKSDCIFVGDFNIDLLKINDRLKYQEYFDLFVSTGFIPQITLPTRLPRRNGTLMDQIYLRSIKPNLNTSSGIILSNLSDHLPHFVSIDCTHLIPNKPKYVNIRKFDENAKENFKNNLRSRNLLSKLDNDLLNDPDPNYKKIENEMVSEHDNCFPVTQVRFNKYKHKINPWITFGILKSLENRDKLYKKMKQTDPCSLEFDVIKTNLHTINKILNQSIRIAKKSILHRTIR